MPVESSNAQSRGTTVLPGKNTSAYSPLFSKINLSPIPELGNIDTFQNTEALSEVCADGRGACDEQGITLHFTDAPVATPLAAMEG